MSDSKAGPCHVIFTGWRELSSVCVPVSRVEGTINSPAEFAKLEREARKRLMSRCDHVSHMAYPPRAGRAA